jgi:hypothetical protein
MRNTALQSIAFALVLTASSARAQDGTVYRLGPDSDHEAGCFGPCACPVLIQSPMTGTFRLRFAGPGEAEEHYQVLDIDWAVPTQKGLTHVTGSGLYTRLLGNPPSQRMDLDLSIDGDAPLRFSSGVDPVTVPWPSLDAVVSRHGEFCWDTLFTVSAAPATADIDPEPGRPRLGAPHPSPFRDHVDLAYTLPAAGGVELAIFEVTGRRVRTLVSDPWSSPGPHTATWDGRDDQGRPVPAGVLFARLRTPSGIARTTLVRIR